MTTVDNVFVWNVRGLNDRARRNVVRQFVVQEQPSLVCLQETKLPAICNRLATEILGAAFDYDFVPSAGASGGIILGWCRERWTASEVCKGRFTLSARLLEAGTTETVYCISVVYGPQSNSEKVEFLDELLQYRSTTPGPWILCGDFNMIYQAQDKSNDRLDRRSMRRFRNFLNRAQLEEVELIGRRFTWSNERGRPTLERLDRCFATADWFSKFPNHCLHPLSTDCSDHCPLFLRLNGFAVGKRRFRFEAFWPKTQGFDEAVSAAWTPTPAQADPLRLLDYKFRHTAKELRKWSSSKIGSVRMQLTLARLVIARFDEEQERRVLHPWQANLRRSLKMRVLGLASLLRSIARQRSRLLFLAEGDANTKFYHLQACHRSRQNRIVSLRVDGNEVVSDQGMAQALYEHYQALLGSVFERSRRLDLQAIGVPVADLADLDRLFTEEEVWSVIKELPSDKAPGPDGYTGRFYKTCWPVIKLDIMNGLNAFWALDSRSLHHLNEAYMVLLKKKDNPTDIRDYRPISLIHSFGKLVTKCLSMRLAPYLDNLVKRNQSAFIKGRCLHDNFREVQIACKAIHSRRQPCILLKIDIAKAFDSVAWNFLLEVLQHMGFSRRWRDWICMILSTSSTKILLNGTPGRRICHARGLRQGDPLSPMLFVIMMDVLNHFLSWLDLRGMLTPVLGLGGPRVSLYADDLVLFAGPELRDFELIKAALMIFGLASGLFANLDKSVATPINCADIHLERVVEALSCRIEGFPCRYLGIPLSLFKLKRSEEQPLVDKVAARIPTWKGNLLNAAGRAALVTATLSAIPVHTAIALCLSPWAIDRIDKLRRGFIWTGSDSAPGGKCKVAWTKVCRPRCLGGLGISDLRRAGVALRVRWVCKDRSLGRLPRTNERSVLALFQAATTFSLGNGESTYFWLDRWLRGQTLQELAPTVAAAVKPRKRKSTVAQALVQNAWVRHIEGPVSMQLVVEVARICDLLEDVHLTSEPDTFAWHLTNDQVYSAASAYGAMFFGSSTPLGAKHIWKTSAPPRVRFFFWLLMHGKCWSSDRSFRHGLQSTNTCILCDQGVESMDHLLLGCCFSREVWSICLSRLHLLHIIVVVEQPVMQWWLRVRRLAPKAVRRGFDSLFFLVGWFLWKERNGRTFDSVSSTPAQLAARIFDEAADWSLAAFRHLRLLIASADSVAQLSVM